MSSAPVCKGSLQGALVVSTPETSRPGEHQRRDWGHFHLFWGLPSNVQGSFLTLSSEITPGQFPENSLRCQGSNPSQPLVRQVPSLESYRSRPQGNIFQAMSDLSNHEDTRGNRPNPDKRTCLLLTKTFTPAGFKWAPIGTLLAPGVSMMCASFIVKPQLH